MRQYMQVIFMLHRLAGATIQDANLHLVNYSCHQEDGNDLEIILSPDWFTLPLKILKSTLKTDLNLPIG